MFLEHSVTATQITPSLNIKCFFNFCSLNFWRLMNFFLVQLDSPKILMILEYWWIFDSLESCLWAFWRFRKDVQYDWCSSLLYSSCCCEFDHLYLYVKFKIVRWSETILKFKCLSATCTCFCRLSLSTCLLQLLFQIFRDFLHLTSGLSCFPKSGPNGSISRADIPRTDIDPRNMSFQCWKVLSTVNLRVEVRSSKVDLILTFSSAKHTGSKISFWF